MTAAANIADTISSFRILFTLLMALAAAEALRQFATGTTLDDDRFLPWDRLPSLLGLLVLLAPFHQGMRRYLFLTYGDPAQLPHPYAAFLSLDAVNFLLEAALFFLMAQALPATRWRRCARTVLVLLVLDCIWVGLTTWLHASAIAPWMFVNLAFVAVFLMLPTVLRTARPCTAATVMMAAILVRTALDYALSWSFYFP